jgi:hypothetical protein
MITRIKQGLANIKGLRDYRHYKVYKRQFKKIFQKHPLCHINKDAEKQYINKWKAISRFVSPYDFRVFSQYIGENPNIVPENVLHDVIEPIFLPKAYKQFYNDKNMYDKLLPKSFLAESLFRCIDGICCDGDYNVFHDIDDQQLLRSCSKYDKIIIKPTHDTGNGSRILLYEKENGFFHPMGHEQAFSINSLIEYFNGNFVIQECLIQSPFTAQFNPTSVNTFRVFTYKSVKTNEVHVLGIVFRMGKENSFVDNNHAGGRYIGVLHDGSFANQCVFDQYGNTYSSFNNIDFSHAKFVVPNFQTVIDFSRVVAENIFHNRTLDLDVMIDSNGNPKLIEYNVDCCSPWLYQFTTGTVYGEFTDEIIEYVKNHM